MDAARTNSRGPVKARKSATTPTGAKDATSFATADGAGRSQDSPSAAGAAASGASKGKRRPHGHKSPGGSRTSTPRLGPMAKEAAAFSARGRNAPGSGRPLSTKGGSTTPSAFQVMARRGGSGVGGLTGSLTGSLPGSRNARGAQRMSKSPGGRRRKPGSAAKSTTPRGARTRRGERHSADSLSGLAAMGSDASTLAALAAAGGGDSGEKLRKSTSLDKFFLSISQQEEPAPAARATGSARILEPIPKKTYSAAPAWSSVPSRQRHHGAERPPSLEGFGAGMDARGDRGGARGPSAEGFPLATLQELLRHVRSPSDIDRLQSFLSQHRSELVSSGEADAEGDAGSSFRAAAAGDAPRGSAWDVTPQPARPQPAGREAAGATPVPLSDMHGAIRTLVDVATHIHEEGVRAAGPSKADVGRAPLRTAESGLSRALRGGGDDRAPVGATARQPQPQPQPHHEGGTRRRRPRAPSQEVLETLHSTLEAKDRAVVQQFDRLLPHADLDVLDNAMNTVQAAVHSLLTKKRDGKSRREVDVDRLAHHRGRSRCSSRDRPHAPHMKMFDSRAQGVEGGGSDDDDGDSDDDGGDDENGGAGAGAGNPECVEAPRVGGARDVARSPLRSRTAAMMVPTGKGRGSAASDPPGAVASDSPLEKYSRSWSDSRSARVQSMEASVDLDLRRRFAENVATMEEHMNDSDGEDSRGNSPEIIMACLTSPRSPNHVNFDAKRPKAGLPIVPMLRLPQPLRSPYLDELAAPVHPFKLVLGGERRGDYGGGADLEEAQLAMNPPRREAAVSELHSPRSAFYMR